MLSTKRQVSSTIRLFEADPEVRNKFWVILRVNAIIKESYKNAYKNNMNINKLVYVLTYSFPRCRYTICSKKANINKTRHPKFQVLKWIFHHTQLSNSFQG